MKISVNLLKQLGKIDKSNEEIVTGIKEHIGEVESYQNLSKDYSDIIVAEIKEKKDHPDADKLGVYQLDTGEKKLVQVLAGDKTLVVGDKVAYLKPGAKVPYTIYTDEKPFIIQSREMRGLLSDGMMGSEKELNLGNDHTVVMRLPDDAPVGKPFAEYYELDDFIIEIENKALTNRGDLFGILGLARELTVIFGKPFTTPSWYLDYTKNLREEGSCLGLNIINDAEALCPRYTAIAMDNIVVEESPLWLKSALIKFGYKPINNIVDITNYMAQLSGQPLHAFDYDKVISNDPNKSATANITIRMAREGESILGLDGKVHQLNDRIMVICDSTNPLAIAGIMGGSETEVDNNTQRIIIESANFDKTSIRKTSMMLGLTTDAGTKFKHALDPNQCIPVLKEAVRMIKEFTTATISSDIIDLYPTISEPKEITLSLSTVNAHLGLDLQKDTIVQILHNLEYQIVKQDNDLLTVKAPTWRMDIAIKEDIHEDIGRIFGYNNIDPVLPVRNLVPAKDNQIFDLKKKIRQVFADSGANETDTYSFVDVSTLEKANLDPDKAYKLKNALAPELSLMRTSLMPSLLTKAQMNIQEGYEKFILFEMNIPHIQGYVDENKLPNEEWHITSIFTSLEKRNDSAYYIAKRYLEKLFGTLNIPNVEYTLISEYLEENLSEDVKNSIYMFDRNTSAIVTVGDIVLGVIGEIDNKVKGNFKLPKYTAGLDININVLNSVDINNNRY
ncbi:phenylalanine--tRNA ligase subunit beta, partial [Patescibacteria group bacterium]|nr:phenylalanine--tRNA ligase subunit beta [Patescibacteria group bacterium]